MGERKQDWSPREIPPFSEADARKYIKKRLRELDWRPAAVDAILAAVESVDGFWSYGTNRVILDLNEIYREMFADHGEPPDRKW